jgi:hypothetical protein
MGGRRGLGRTLRLRRLPAVAITLAVASAALVTAGGTGASAMPVRVPHLPSKLAQAHAEALRDAPKAGAGVPGPSVSTGARLVRAVSVSAVSVGTPTAIGGDQRLVVRWTPPDPAGLSSIEATAYDVASPNVVAGSCTVAVSASNCSIGGLVNGHQYTAQVSTCDGSGTCTVAGSVGAATVARWPDPVSNLTVTGGNNSITASWSPPANNGGLAVDQYYVLLYPATYTDWCYAAGPMTAVGSVSNTRVTFDAATAAAYNGSPVNGTNYKVTVFPENDTADGYNPGNDDCYPNAGTGQDITNSSAVANPVTANLAQSGQYKPVAPVSLLGSGGTTVTGGSTVQSTVLRQGTVPPSGVAAVTLGVSVTGSSGAEVYVWDSDQSQPFDPTLTTSAGAVQPGYNQAAGTVTVPIGASGAVSISSSLTATVHLDVLGYYQDGTLSDAGSQYVGISPATIYNSQATSAYPLSLGVWYWTVRPGAAAAVVAVTVSSPSTYGALTLSKTTASATVPDTPALFYGAGQYTSSVTTVPINSVDGSFQLQLSAGTATVKVTVLGYYTGPGDPAGGDSAVVPQASGSTGVVRATMGSGGSPSVTVPWPTGAPAVASVLTEWLLIKYQPVSGGTLSVYPTGSPSAAVPLVVSSAGDGQALIPVPRTASDGSVTIAALYGATATVDIDVVGYTQLLGNVPQQPGGVDAAPIAGGAYLTWYTPCPNGGPPVTQYEIITSPGGVTLTVDGNQTNAFMHGLTDGTSYSFEIVAINAVGAGAASPWTAAVTPAPTVPDPPDQPGAQAGDSSALVSWDTPAHDGDSAITGYTITGYPANGTTSFTRTVSGAATHQLVITGLSDGTAYMFQVAASNAIGDGEPSVASISITPSAGAPIAPALALTAARSPAVASSVAPCQPLAAMSRPQAAANPDQPTSRQYQIDGHILTETTPPASLDLGTASLATLHKYNYALQIKTTAALRAWQKRIGHSHAVPVTPCVMQGHAPSSATAQFGTALSCWSSVEGASSANTLNPGTWSGILAFAHDKPLPPAQGALMDTGDPFQTVDGEWQQTTNAADPSGANLLSSWVGIGGYGHDSHAQLQSAELIQAGTDEQTNNTPRFWWEVISYENSVPAISVDGISGNRTDAFYVSVTVRDADKVRPLNPISQQDFAAGIDNGVAVFNWFDFTNGQSAAFEITRVYTDYDGRTAEWVNEAPISGSALAGLPQFAPIKWLQANATASYNAPQIDSGPVSLWTYDKMNLGYQTNPGSPTPHYACVAGPTNISMTSFDASWTETRSNTC